MTLAPLNVPELLRRHGLRPDKSLGQNFLVDPQALQRVVDSAEITAENTILEIGAGLGSLTRLLAGQARRVVTVELDDRLIPVLHEVLAQYSNVQIVQGDILALNIAEFLCNVDHTVPAYRVVANIPYYISSAIIRRLLEAAALPERLILTVQLEVAQRICATPGDLSLLALSVQVYGSPRVVARIPAGAFYPAPQVDSAVVRIDVYPQPVIPLPLLPGFFRLAKAGFSQKRKTLRNAVSAGMGWNVSQTDELFQQAGIDSRRRAETLSLAEWRALVEQLPPHPKDPTS
jgi:16S rRNA (adenine1518-N6/adenine1519-N6)-dimethyltransferase